MFFVGLALFVVAAVVFVVRTVVFVKKKFSTPFNPQYLYFPSFRWAQRP
jgi:hypothetical protein